MIFVFLFWLVFHPLQGAGQIPLAISSKLENLSSQAQAAASRRDYADAAHAYERMLQLWPHLPEVQANLGMMDHLLGRYSEAIPNFKSALREKPDSFPANFFLGVDLLRLRRPRHALPYIEKADRLNPRNLQVQITLGEAFADLNQYDKANEAYHHAVELGPRNINAIYGLGITYLNLQQLAVEKLAGTGKDSLYARRLLAESFAQEGRSGDSIRIYQKLISSYPRALGLHTALGLDYLAEGNSAPAAPEFREELRIHPGFLTARLGLARIDFEKGNTSEGVATLEKLWKTDPGFLWANRGILWLATDSQKSAALERQIQAIAGSVQDSGLRALMDRGAASLEDAPDYLPEVELEKGGVARNTSASPVPATSPEELFAAGQYTACVRKLNAAKTRLSPSRWSLLAKCSYFSGVFRTSFLAAGTLLRREPDNPEALYWRAKAGMKLSLQTLITAGLSDPGSYQTHLLMGQSYLGMHRFGRAEAEFQKALDVEPGNLAAQSGLAVAYWKNLKFDRALPYLKNVLAVNPADSQANYIMGEILVEKHQYKEAPPYLRKAAQGTDKMALYAYALLGKVEAAQGRTREAALDIQKSLAADNDGALHFQLYQLYRKLGDAQAASAALRESERIRHQQEQGAQALIEIPH